MISFYTDEELQQVPTGTAFVFDIEVYPNYVLVAFRNVETDKHVIFEFEDVEDYVIERDLRKLTWFIWRYCLVGFNSANYDLPLLTMIVCGFEVHEIKRASDRIILGDERIYKLEEQLGFRCLDLNHVDLIEVAPLKGSLKLYGGRLHCKTIWELPYDPNKPLNTEQMHNIVSYCCNDLEQTKLLYQELKPHIELREAMSKEYGFDLRSHSDAQLAESIIGSEIKKITGFVPKKLSAKEKIRSCNYNVPEFMRFQTPMLNRVLQTIASITFEVQDNGSIRIPETISKSLLHVGSSIYKLGIGGLHSTESEVSYKADEHTLLIDRDVSSYYPRIILNQKLYPRHLGTPFLQSYDSIVTRRLEAKKAGNKKTSEGLKIASNGTFGKLGNEYSILYAPDLMLQVTISGQLCLLMLIEAIELAEIPVVSGNTDGILIACPTERYQELAHIVEWWQSVTGFETEETRYAAVYARDVNNYVTVKDLSQETPADREKRTGSKFLSDRLGCKTKGFYAEFGSAQNSVLSKNPENQICKDAVLQKIVNNKPIEQTIAECTDIRRFVTVRNVTGGAEKKDQYVGKVIRTYYAKGIYDAIKYRKSGNQVPKSVGAKPLLTLPDELPSDIDYERYCKETVDMLFDIGYYKRTVNESLF